ncbi:MAG: ABC transporter ATP-binding protein [Thermoanaerobaculum sp.]
MPWLQVHQLSVAFPTAEGLRKVVDGVSFSLERGETLGLAGESGSGKTLSLMALGALVPPPGQVVGGSVTVDGVNVLAADEAQQRRIRGGVLGFVFQHPALAFNPVLSVGRQVMEAAVLHGLAASQAKARALELLAAVGLTPPLEFFRAYPHELSGGQIQRAALAAALSGKPQALVLDEPTSALDLLAQAAFVNLLKELAERYQLALLLASHDLSLLSALCQKLVVVAAGETVEEGLATEVLQEPLHPATVFLTGQSFKASPPQREGQVPGKPAFGEVAQGETERPATPNSEPFGSPKLPLERLAASGCRFAPRCPWVFDRCLREHPSLALVGSGRLVRCFLHHQEGDRG